MVAHLTGFVQDALLLVVEEEEVGARLSQVLEDAQVAVRGRQVERGALLQILITMSSLLPHRRHPWIIYNISRT